MNTEKVVAGFIGAGGIARAHAFALNSLKYYYNEVPVIETDSVCSASEISRVSFAEKYGFKNPVSIDEFISSREINTVYILGPNNVHAEHLKKASEMAAVKRIYIEKPVCSTTEEENQIAKIIQKHPEIRIQAGFQYLFMSSVREALKLWKSGIFGPLIHFDFKYYHGDYLHKEYRDKRATRLTPAPDGGAMADLGSHAISLAIAFLGNSIQITNALQSGHYNDVTALSDLYSLISLYDKNSGAAGTLAASRVSSGTGDTLSLELYAEKGCLRLSSAAPEYFEYYLEETGSWYKIVTGSNYKPVTTFPSGHVPPGWLRSMIHAHYVFLTGKNHDEYVPDISHALEVQRIVRETSGHLSEFRKKLALM